MELHFEVTQPHFAPYIAKKMSLFKGTTADAWIQRIISFMTRIFPVQSMCKIKNS